MSDVDPGSTLGMSVSEYFDTGLYSDLRIKDSNGHEYAVHRIIVCGQSTVLAKACKPEHGFKEAQTGVIDLKHDDPGAVAAMLEFMYRGVCTFDDSDNPMLHAARAYVIGEIYFVLELKDFAATEFQELSSTGWDTADFTAAVRVIYESVPDTDKGGIRDIVTGVVAEHYDKLLTKAEFEAVLDDFGALGKDVLRALAKIKAQAPKPRTYKCISHINFKKHTALMTLNHNLPEQHSQCSSCGHSRSNKDWETLIYDPEIDDEW